MQMRRGSQARAQRRRTRMAELEEQMGEMDQETLEKAEKYAKWLLLFTEESGLKGAEIDAFVCSMSFMIMQDPVICADGHTYEGQATPQQERVFGHPTKPPTSTVTRSVTHFIPPLEMTKACSYNCRSPGGWSSQMVEEVV